MQSQAFLTFNNPATGEQFGQVPMATLASVHEAREEMRAAAKIWGKIPVRERVRIMRLFQEVLIDSLDEITEVMNRDTGKSRQDALIEAFMTIDMLSMYLKKAPRWLKKQVVSTGLYLFKRAYVEPRPYGVVAVIAPWNYPFALSLPAVLGALLAGNTVMFKPSEVTAATGVLIENLFKRVPELSPFIRVLHGDGQVGAALVESCPDYIFLTGSTATGRLVARAAAERLIPFACELGGKDAMLVLGDADLQKAAHWGAWGACFNSGQTCMGVERVYVVAEVYDEFVRCASEAMARLHMGYSPELKNQHHLGPISDPRQLKIIAHHLQDALDKGARLLYGGGQNGMFFEPTLLVDVDHSMLVMREETFGPIMPIVKAANEEEAIQMANDSTFGLGASIWSKDIKHARQVAHRVEAASIVINDTISQFAIAALPFGGIKESGYGRTHGKEGLMQFTRPYSYAYGQPPLALDVATIARQPGRYDFVSFIIHTVFGVTPRQKVKPLADLARQASTAAAALSAAGASTRSPDSTKRRAQEASANRAMGVAAGLVAGAAGAAALTGMIISGWKRGRGR